MEKAKAAVQEFTSKHGKNDTTVHESHRPAVTHTHVLPTEHVAEQTVVDKEVHQQHHHTSVQPIHDRQVLPEKHHHQIVPVEHKEHYHGDHESMKPRLDAEAAKFKDVTETGKTEHTHEVRPVVGGTHVHHHVHETIQPIIQRETIQPSVVHTTVPIHEVHHNEPKHHAATALPAMTMEQFKKGGGILEGRGEKTDRFDGEPDSESTRQHLGHSGSHLHGLKGHGHENEGNVLQDNAVGREGARDLRNETAGNMTHDHANHGLRGTGERSEHHRGAEAAAVSAVGGTGAVAAGAHHHQNQNDPNHLRNNRDIDGQTDSRVDQRLGGNTRDVRDAPLSARKEVGTASTTDSAVHHTGSSKLHKEPPTNQFADTHIGSKMDTAGDHNAVSVSTGNGAERALNNQGVQQHPQSSGEAANGAGNVEDSSPSSTKKRTGLMGMLRGSD